ncbi:hypothetical protein ZOSMA_101G00170 [Zostera marina]|uniref:Uncharacterized protein n=1 Tax=Zostera marina TaxID=29655 RepID=A0A0K9Q570_ZOSMR|nr:hypothetical protein ZOSMA_101G00170 [Zostera marina]
MHLIEAGDIDDLAASLHFYNFIYQIGLAMSPFSNNSLFLDYQGLGTQFLRLM